LEAIKISEIITYNGGEVKLTKKYQLQKLIYCEVYDTKKAA
jgi:hypothetical protein